MLLLVLLEGLLLVTSELWEAREVLAKSICSRASGRLMRGSSAAREGWKSQVSKQFEQRRR